MDKFTYIPKLKRFLPATLSFALLVVSSVFSYFSLHTEMTLLFTVFASFFIVISFQVFFRYCLTEHIYTVYRGVFTVTRKTGKHTVTVFDLVLSPEYEILPKKEGKRRIKNDDYRVIYRTANLFARNKFYLFYDERAVCVEIDGEFAKMIEKFLI